MQTPSYASHVQFPKHIFHKRICPKRILRTPGLYTPFRAALSVILCVVVFTPLACGTSAAPPVTAHSSKRNAPDPSFLNQNEMNQKAADEFSREDARLHLVYKKVLGKLDAVGKKKLVRAQRAWLAYRDAQASLVSDEMRGGSAEPMLYSGTQATLSRERVKALQDLLSSR